MRLLPQSVQHAFLHQNRASFCIFLALVLPAGARASSPQVVASPANVVFGTVMVGQSQSEEVVLVNNGTTPVAISAFSVNDSAFNISGLNLPETIPASGRITLNVTFSPAGGAWTYGDAVFTSNASNSQLKITLAGAGGKSARLKAQPSSISFGNVTMGQTATVPVTLTNSSHFPVTLIALRGFGSGFSASGLTFPEKLTPGQTATLHVSFTPTAGGVAGGSILIEGGSLNIPVTGSGQTAGAGVLSLTPATLNFGDVDLGSSAGQSATLTATGGAVTIASATSTNSQYTISGISFPITLSSGQSTEFKLSFSPSTAGSSSATVTVTSNASDTHASEAASGTGVTVQYSVNLSWNPSSSSVSGYNVYRGTQPGSYSRINPSLDGTTSYVDNSVASGTTYYYAATAVSTGGQESGYSAPIKVSIP